MARHQHLTYEFSNGIKIYHGGGWGGILSFKGTKTKYPSEIIPKIGLTHHQSIFPTTRSGWTFWRFHSLRQEQRKTF